MPIPFTDKHRTRYKRDKKDPLYHGDQCEEVYLEIMRQQTLRNELIEKLKTDKSVENKLAFHTIQVIIKSLKAEYQRLHTDLRYDKYIKPYRLKYGYRGPGAVW